MGFNGSLGSNNYFSSYNDYQPRLRFFSGHMKTEEFINWLEEVEEYFEYQKTEESLKVLFVEIYLKNDALIWWEDFQKDRKRFGMDRIQSWPVMKQVMWEEYLPNDYFKDFCHAEDTVEDISYEVEIVEGIEDEPWILEVEDYDPTIDIDCTLDVAQAKLEAKSISIDKVSKGDNLCGIFNQIDLQFLLDRFENSHKFFGGNLRIVFLHLDFEDPTLLLPSEVYSFKPVIDKMVHLKYYPPIQNLARLEDEFFLRGGEYHVGWKELATRNCYRPNLHRCPVVQAAAFSAFHWTFALVPLWIWDGLRRDFSVGVYHSHKTNRGSSLFTCLSACFNLTRGRVLFKKG
ncbi:hypothetical protein Dsin_000145 [Dipteronia sinensis]|uniref:Retrotransposon gag domain-containing protein n=1 Tax=Dipteronia sinensis TaxID=43782 RepID=A0AAE0DIA6_9ROSI|nr:hypothetical protein Dsin_000145 [Dipteronia sinensis]